MSSLTILHLSDLHISEAIYEDQKIILQALFKDLRKKLSDGCKFDLIIFSGDLIGKGNYSKENIRIVKEEFFKALLESTELNADCVFFVPGNHDFDVKNFPPMLRPVLDDLDSINKTNKFIDDFEVVPQLSAGFQNFNELVDSLLMSVPIYKNDLFRAYKLAVNGFEIGICCINSAWKATGRANNADYGQLQVGQHQLDKLIESVKECTIKFAILHHPLSWLAPLEQTEIKNLIYRNFNAIFYGHNHNANSLNIAGPSYNTFESNAGCLYHSRDFFNGYSIINFDKDNSAWNVKVREYYNDRGVFDVSTRFAENGELTFSLNLDQKALSTLEFPAADYVSAVKDSVNGHLLTTTISDIAPKSLGALFVPPPLSHLSERKLSEDGKNGDEVKYLDLKELLKKNNPLFFVGQKEYGKTTLLHYICSEYNELHGSKLPVYGSYINLESVKPTTAGLTEAIVLFSRGACRKSDFTSLLKEGRMVVCFDNLQVNDDKLLSALKTFINQYPDNQYYFSVHESFQASISQKVIPKLGLEASVVYLHSFGRKQTRKLISKWFGDSNEELRNKVDAMLMALKRLNIPRTPFLISILLWVQEKEISFHPVNQAEIIDILIDGVLEKLQETKSRSNYDSTVKRHYLTELAYEMHRLKKKRLSLHELESFSVKYFHEKALPSASGKLIEELILKGVLVDLGNVVSFKFECMRAFFLSSKIKESKELFDYSMTPEGFLELGQELDYYTGKNRDDADALKGALEIVEHFAKMSGLAFELEVFDEIGLKDSPITPDKLEVFEQKVLGNRPSAEMQEEMLDEIHQDYIDVKSPKPEFSNETPDFFNSLQIASSVLRNSELISNAKLKYEAYVKITRFWCQIIMVILAYVETYEDEKETEEKVVKESVPEMPKEFSMYLLKLLMPNAIFAMAHEYIGTPKLKHIILQDIESDSAQTICKLLSTVLYADLEFEDRLAMLKKLADEKKSVRYLNEIIFFKLLHLFIFRKLNPDEESKIKPLIAEIFVRLSNAKDQRTAKHIKGKLMQSLNKNKLLKASQSDDSNVD